MKSQEEAMHILEAYDLTGSLRAAAELAGVSHHTVERYVAQREAEKGSPTWDPPGPAHRSPRGEDRGVGGAVPRQDPGGRVMSWAVLMAADGQNRGCQWAGFMTAHGQFSVAIDNADRMTRKPGSEDKLLCISSPRSVRSRPDIGVPD